MLLNLLIAIVSEIYDQVMSTKVSQVYKEKAKLLIDLEKLFINSRAGGKKQYLHLLRYAKAADEGAAEFESKIRKITGKIAALS